MTFVPIKLLKLFRYVPLIDEIELSHHKACIQARSLERAGNCGYEIQDAAAGEILGHTVLDQARPSSTQTQFVGTELDISASDDAIRLAIAKLSPGENVSSCFYPAGVPHSMVSRFDNPTEKKYWLPSLLEDATAFVVSGKAFPVLSDQCEIRN